MTQNTKLFTLAEVKTHNGKDDPRVWIIYEHSVYDVTDYLDEHPSGEDLIHEYAGLDATKAFDDSGYTSDAKKQLKSFKIGEIVEEERAGKAKKKTGKKCGAQAKTCMFKAACGFCGFVFILCRAGLECLITR